MKVNVIVRNQGKNHDGFPVEGPAKTFQDACKVIMDTGITINRVRPGNEPPKISDMYQVYFPSSMIERIEQA
jgi:hypothetical protein